MTTPEAAERYRAEYVESVSGRPVAIHNPHQKPVEDLSVIYGFNNGGSSGWYSGVLISEDGFDLGGHVCSHECYMPGDLGVIEGSRTDRHKTFREHYPDGYRMEFVGYKDVKTHEGLMAAIDRAMERDEKNTEAAMREPSHDQP